MTQLLIDTDIFCKLGIANLLEDALRTLGFAKSDCARLPALPHMLRRGRLVKKFGPESCAALAVLAESIPSIRGANSELLDLLAANNEIDVGEAQLYAVAAQHACLVLSGDKRALRVLGTRTTFCVALDGRIIILEAVLLALCNALGAETVCARIQAVKAFDTMISVCFAAANADPIEGLRSYFRATVSEVAPLILWSPEPEVAS